MEQEGSPWADGEIYEKEAILVSDEEKVFNQLGESVQRYNLSEEDIDLVMEIFLESENEAIKEKISQKENSENILKLAKEIKEGQDKLNPKFIQIPKLTKYLKEKILETLSGFDKFLRNCHIKKSDRLIIHSICDKCEEGELQLIRRNNKGRKNRKTTSLKDLVDKMEIVLKSEKIFLKSISLSRDTAGNTPEEYRLYLVLILKEMDLVFPDIKMKLIPQAVMDMIREQALQYLLERETEE